MLIPGTTIHQCSLDGCWEHATVCSTLNDHSCVPVCLPHRSTTGAIAFNPEEDEPIEDDG